MRPAEVVTNLIEALESGDWDRAAIYLSDDFVLSGPTPRPLDRGQFLEFMRAMRAAFPDWSFNPKDLREQGNAVMVTFRNTGTQTGDLVVPMPGMPSVPATGKCISLPEEPAMCTVRGDQVTAINVQPVPSGGFLGILQQLGIQLPTRTV